MARFFISPEDIDRDGNTAAIRGEDAYHIARSLRMAEGDGVTLCDGRGTDYSCRLTRIRDDECTAEILDTHPSESEPPAEITLFMAYPKGDKLETVIQKAVELGAAKIIPFESSRCIKRPSAEKDGRRLTRLTRIAKEAAKQCGRGIIPEVLPTLRFREVLARRGEFDTVLFAYEGDGTVSLRSVLEGMREDTPRRLAVVVGSEGGFSPEEANEARDAGFTPVNLGPRILRCETAPDYILSAISYAFEL